jgi:hypothetical protein
MKKLLIAAALPLALLTSACADFGERPSDLPPASPPAASSSLVLVAGVEATEAATRARCPRGAIEEIVVAAARTAFDILYRSRLSAGEADRVDEARRMTDEVCGLVAVPVSAPPPPEDSSAPI